MNKAIVPIHTTNTAAGLSGARLELVCAVDTLVSLRAAVDNGADRVCMRSGSTAGERGFPALRVGDMLLSKSIRYAHDNGCRLAFELETGDDRQGWLQARNMINRAAAAGVDAVILSDLPLMLYAVASHPGLRVHYAVSDAALHCVSLDMLRKQFGVARIILPAALSLAHVKLLSGRTPLELEVAGFGTQCAVMTARRPAQAPEEAASAERISPPAQTGRCAGVEAASNDGRYAIGVPPAADLLKLLPQLLASGVSAIRVESSGRGPLQLAQITKIWREAIDDCLDDACRYSVRATWIAGLDESLHRR